MPAKDEEKKDGEGKTDKQSELLKAPQPTVNVEEFKDSSGDFEVALKKITGDGETCAEFREEYVRLFDTIKDLHEKEEVVIKKAKTMISNVESKQEKLNLFKKSEEEFEFKRKNMQNDIDRLQKEIRSSLEKEETAKTQMTQLDSSISELDAQVKVA